MSNDCKSRDVRQALPAGGAPITMRVEGGRSCWLVGMTQGAVLADYSGCDVELWGNYGGGNALLRVQRLGVTMPDSPIVVRWSSGWFNSYEARIINRTQPGPGAKNAPLTAWTLHSWDGTASNNEPCGFTRWSSRAVSVSNVAATLILPGDPNRRRALVSLEAAALGDFILVGESAATVATDGFPVAPTTAIGAAFTNQIPFQLHSTGEIWGRAFAASPVPVRVISERE